MEEQKSAKGLVSQNEHNFSIDDDIEPPVTHRGSDFSTSTLDQSATSEEILTTAESYGDLFATPAGVDDENRQIYRLISQRKFTRWQYFIPWLGSRLNESTFSQFYLHFTFQTSFFALVGSFIVIYVLFSFLFALLIWLMGHLQENCIDPSFEGMSTKGQFMNAFHLSWTTFSTVGYGMIAPATRASDAFSHENGEQHFTDAKRCAALSIMCSFEAFVGMAFAAFCGAIMFGKVARIHSVAPVLFTEQLVIRYENKTPNRLSFSILEILEEGEEEDDDDDDCEQSASLILNRRSGLSLNNRGCPILELRIVNRLCNHGLGGEINDASIIATAKLCRKGLAPITPSGNAPVVISKHKREVGMSWSRASSSTNVVSIKTNGERHSSMGSTTISFTKLEFTPQYHPLFQNVWTLQHYLNETSPLLSDEIRKQIRIHGGYWPNQLKNYESIRNGLEFEKILISLSGTSPINAAKVHTHHLYEKDDIIIGYQFANVMYRNDVGEVHVDLTKINDVNPQPGGGHEPLTDVE